MSDGMPNTEGVSARTGVWFVGARGSVAATDVAGALAVRSGLTDQASLVSEVAAAGAARDRLEATDVRDLLPDLAGVPARTGSLT